MKPTDNNSKKNFFEHLSIKVTQAAASNAAIVFAFGSVILWAIAGWFFNYSKNWQMFISITTAIITFLMVFLIQKSQNKESLAVQLKLNELLSAHESASNHLVDVENMTEDELKVIQKYYTKLKSDTSKEEFAQKSNDINEEKK